MIILSHQHFYSQIAAFNMVLAAIILVLSIKVGFQVLKSSLGSKITGFRTNIQAYA
jgi:hypothetical protein